MKKKYFLYIALLLPILVSKIADFSENMKYEQNLYSPIKVAMSSQSIDVSISNIHKAITFLESRNLTQGNTSLFYETIDDDLFVFYNNLRKIRSDLSDMRKSNSTSHLLYIQYVRSYMLIQHNGQVSIKCPKYTRYEHRYFLRHLMYVLDFVEFSATILLALLVFILIMCIAIIVALEYIISKYYDDDEDDEKDDNTPIAPKPNNSRRAIYKSVTDLVRLN